MKLDENSVKSILEEFQESRDIDYLRRFQEEVCDFIENWVQVTYKCSIDIARDFLVYVLERSEQIMLSCPQNLQVLFKTWFVAVLSNKFADFSRSREIFSPYLTCDLDFYQETISEHDPSLSLGYPRFLEILQLLSFEEQSLATFLYMPLDISVDHVNVLSEMTQKPIHQIMRAYYDVLQVQELALQNQEGIQEQKDKISQKITYLKKMSNKTDPQHEKQSLETKIAYFENRLYKLSLKMKTKKKVLLKIFEELMGDYQTAYTLIRKIELKISLLSSDCELGD
ncbi:MAG: hypothetical protein ACRCS8_03955 [Brevinema sp.]